MKQLIEDYKRRLATVNEMIEESANARKGIEEHQRLLTKAGMFRTFIAELEREFKSKLSATEEVWVIQDHFASDVDHVFIDKEEAEKEAEQRKEEFLTYYRKVNKRMSDEEWKKYAETFKNKFTVITLDQAIDNIRDNIHDDYASHGDPSY